MKFPKKFLQALLYNDHKETEWPDAEIVQDIITSTSRWSIYHEMVFTVNGKFYIIDYSIGATEHQDESPFEYEPEEIECEEVVPKITQAIVYEVKKD